MLSHAAAAARRVGRRAGRRAPSGEDRIGLSGDCECRLYRRLRGAGAFRLAGVARPDARDDLVDYFRRRQLDAARCALHAWCYSTLREKGASADEAARALFGKGRARKNEPLFHAGVNYNDVPAWQRRGVGLLWETYEKPGYDPVRRQTVTAARRRLRVNMELPAHAAYDDFIRRLLHCF